MTRWDAPAPAEPRSRRSVVLVVLLLVALAVTMGGIFPFRQIVTQIRQVEETRAELVELKAANAELDSQIAALNTNAGVEQLAREQFGLAKPGEETFEVDGPLIIEPPEAAPVVDTPDNRGLLQRFWDFLTGRDLDAPADG